MNIIDRTLLPKLVACPNCGTLVRLDELVQADLFAPTPGCGKSGCIYCLKQEPRDEENQGSEKDG